MCDDLAIDEHTHTQESTIGPEGLFHLMVVQPGGNFLLTSLLPFTLALPYATSLQSNYTSLLARLPHQRPAIPVAC